MSTLKHRLSEFLLEELERINTIQNTEQRKTELKQLAALTTIVEHM